ncbi:MAG: DNA/RNA helicase domain-containing protein [Candidatus Spyradenecus sp.]
MGDQSRRCMYAARVGEFLETAGSAVRDAIVSSAHGEWRSTAWEAWEGEVALLQRVLAPWREADGYLCFEYDIPRLGKRIDVVLLLGGLIFCLEFKVGKGQVAQADVEQVLDYALDLKNFHQFSADRPIVPVLVPTASARSAGEGQRSPYHAQIFNPVVVGAEGLGEVIARFVTEYGCPVDPQRWGERWLISPYSPTPTIIEAARALYENHSVEEITRHEADKVSTDATIAFVQEVIERTRRAAGKAICFVTGVPGAGKTLVGLDVAVKQQFRGGAHAADNQAVYLSGNGPLVSVLTEALARDNTAKCRARQEKKKLSDARREVRKFIQMVHNYRDNMMQKLRLPIVGGRLEIDPAKAVRDEAAGFGEVEHVVIFDEAQRAWTHARLANYLKRGGTYGNKLKVADFPLSEAAFLIWSVDQRKDWAVIICLVGGGQEINTGEAGIAEWLRALNQYYRDWQVYISDQLVEREYAEGRVAELLRGNPHVTYSSKLHLAVSQRSFRAERLADFVQALLNFNPTAAALYQAVDGNGYPVRLTRSIAKARAWLRANALGSTRTGILISKVAARYKPQAVQVLPQGDENAVHWFLEDKGDVRASNYLEDAATEIQVQGLELDYACILWDADFRCEAGPSWGYYAFNGRTAWRPERNGENRQYMLNAYRVLLTRARQGIVICVPEGNDRRTPEGFYEDATRLPAFYDGTYHYLRSLGIAEL